MNVFELMGGFLGSKS